MAELISYCPRCKAERVVKDPVLQPAKHNGFKSYKGKCTVCNGILYYTTNDIFDH